MTIPTLPDRLTGVRNAELSDERVAAILAAAETEVPGRAGRRTWRARFVPARRFVLGAAAIAAVAIPVGFGITHSQSGSEEPVVPPGARPSDPETPPAPTFLPPLDTTPPVNGGPPQTREAIAAALSGIGIRGWSFELVQRGDEIVLQGRFDDGPDVSDLEAMLDDSRGHWAMQAVAASTAERLGRWRVTEYQESGLGGAAYPAARYPAASDQQRAFAERQLAARGETLGVSIVRIAWVGDALVAVVEARVDGDGLPPLYADPRFAAVAGLLEGQPVPPELTGALAGGMEYQRRLEANPANRAADEFLEASSKIRLLLAEHLSVVDSSGEYIAGRNSTSSGAPPVGGGSPIADVDAAVQDWFIALALRREGATASQNVCGRLTEKDRRERCSPNDVLNSDAGLISPDEAARAEVGVSSYRPRRATVRYRVGHGPTLTLRLVREGGAWKVALP
jgi:hypothetical protein